MSDHPFFNGLIEEIQKEAGKKESTLGKLASLIKEGRKVVHFKEKDVPAKSKEIYSAIKRKLPEMERRYPGRGKEVAARTALKLGK